MRQLFFILLLAIVIAACTTEKNLAEEDAQSSRAPGNTNSVTFQDAGVNPIENTQDDNVSTFAWDVDTASYAIARRYLTINFLLPPLEAIRPEEFINYFDMGYTPPEDETFAMHIDTAPSPFGDDGTYLMRVGVQGRIVPPEERTANLLIFVIDVSGSMDDDNRLQLAKASLELLVDELREDDRIGIVVYSDQSRVVLEPTTAAQRDRIMSAINQLQTEGSTNVQDGLALGYDLAQEHTQDGQATRLIVLSDGVANVAATDADTILATVRDAAADDITLTTIGLGMSNYNDVLMEQLANDGDGNYYYVDTLNEAERVFVDELTTTLEVIGYDAKMQVVFNPAVVEDYRLIGYENRALDDDDFRDDDVDAGEIGAGDNVTALYEITFTDDAAGEIGMVSMRYEDATAREVIEISQTILMEDVMPSLDVAPASFRLAATAAEFSELLRASFWAQDNTYANLLDFAYELPADVQENPEVVELIDLIERAAQLSG